MFIVLWIPQAVQLCGAHVLDHLCLCHYCTTSITVLILYLDQTLMHALQETSPWPPHMTSLMIIPHALGASRPALAAQSVGNASLGCGSTQVLACELPAEYFYYGSCKARW